MSLRRFAYIGLALLLLALPTSASADFGFAPGKTIVSASKNGIPTFLSGSHPDLFTVGFELNKEASERTEGGEMRDVIVDLPPGFLGNPEAVKACTRQQFEG